MAVTWQARVSELERQLEQEKQSVVAAEASCNRAQDERMRRTYETSA